MRPASAISSIPSWCSSTPESFMYEEQYVHVWKAGLERTSSQLESLWSILAPDERRRAEAFCFRKDRDHFVAARGLLRVILGRYLSFDPKEVRFCYGTFGKPMLATGCDRRAIRFNLSHSHGLALYAVTRYREIGVDLEYICAELAGEEIAERFFSPREAATLRTLPHELRTEAFFNCWTRKEAYIKARGEGLSLPLDQFDVTLAPGEPAALLRTSMELHEASRWSLLGLTPADGYVAALAVEGYSGAIKYWQLT